MPSNHMNRVPGCPNPDEDPSKDPGGTGRSSWTQAAEALMVFDSNVFMDPRWTRASGGPRVPSFCPFKHTNRAHKLALNGISVSEECEPDERGRKRSEGGRGCQPPPCQKARVPLLQLLRRFRRRSKPSGEICLEKRALTSGQIIKRVYVRLCPGGKEITNDKSSAQRLEEFGSLTGLKSLLGLLLHL